MIVVGDRRVHIIGILLVFIPHFVATENVTVSQLYNAFEDSYNPQQSFEDNFYTILTIACPASVFCKPEQRLPYIDNKTETTQLTANISSSDSSNTVSMARNFLLETVHELAGCCSDCSCETDCFENGNCCLDAENRDEIPTMPKICVTASIYARIPDFGTEHPDSYFMITECFKDYPKPDVREKCQHPDIKFPDQIWPVYSNNTNKIYWNKYCAECNMEDDFLIWQVRVLLPQYLNFVFSFPDSASQLYELFLKEPSSFEFIFDPPKEVSAIVEKSRCFDEATRNLNSAPPTCRFGEMENPKSRFINEACFYAKAKYLQFLYGGYFRNVFCAICSIRKFIQPQTCSTKGSKQVTFGLVSLLDVDSMTKWDVSRDDPDDGDDGNSLCKCAEWLDVSTRECRPILCPPGEVYENCECRRFLNEISGVPINMYLRINLLSGPQSLEDISRIYTQKKHMKRLMSEITRQLKTITEEVVIEHYIAFLCQNESKYFLYFVSSFVVKFGSDTRDVASLLYTDLRNGLPFTTNGHKWLLNLGPMYEISFEYISPNHIPFLDESVAVDKHLLLYTVTIISLSKITRRSPLSKVLFCTRIVLFPEEIQLLDNGTVPAANLDYIFKSQDVSMCFDDFKSLFYPNVASGSVSTTQCNIPNYSNWRPIKFCLYSVFALALLI